MGISSMMLEDKTDLGWDNVALGLTFIAFDAGLSLVFGLGIGTSLLSAALRCVVQLTVVATILQKVFATESFWAVAGISVLLNLLGTFETVVVKSNRRYRYMFPAVLFAMLFSTIPVSALGAHFAMGIRPFWRPEQYIPLVGMLCGSTVSAIAIAVSHVLKELDVNKDRTETYLVYGATRIEACLPVARDALRVALTPSVNRMSVLGIIAIPGMMTGALLGGSSVQQAARLQMVIVFMISSSEALSCVITTFLALLAMVDREHRLRPDHVDTRLHAVWRARDRVGWAVVGGVKDAGMAVGRTLWPFGRRKQGTADGLGERQRLLPE